MKFFKAIFFVFSLFFSWFSFADAAMFAGDWESSSSVKDDSSNFQISFKVHGSEISGKYCSVTRGGRKIDCDPEGEDNIHGKIDTSGDHAQIVFDSFFGARNGVAQLTLKGGKLIWKVVSAPTGGDFFGPKSSVLDRFKETAVVGATQLPVNPIPKKDAQVFYSEKSAIVTVPINGSNYRIIALGGSAGADAGVSSDCQIISDLNPRDNINSYSGVLKEVHSDIVSYGEDDIKGKRVSLSIFKEKIVVDSIDTFGLCSLNTDFSGTYKLAKKGDASYVNNYVDAIAVIDSTSLFFYKNKNINKAVVEMQPFVETIDWEMAKNKKYIKAVVSIANNYAFYLQAIGKNDEAVIVFKKVLSVDPKRYVAYLNIADSLWDLGDTKAAVENYEIYSDFMSRAGLKNKIPPRVFQRKLAK